LQQTDKLASFDYLPVLLGKPNTSKARTKLLAKTLKTLKPANAQNSGAVRVRLILFVSSLNRTFAACRTGKPEQRQAAFY
jgi:hypothetical protein